MSTRPEYGVCGACARTVAFHKNAPSVLRAHKVSNRTGSEWCHRQTPTAWSTVRVGDDWCLKTDARLRVTVIGIVVGEVVLRRDLKLDDSGSSQTERLRLREFINLYTRMPLAR